MRRFFVEMVGLKSIKVGTTKCVFTPFIIVLFTSFIIFLESEWDVGFNCKYKWDKVFKNRPSKIRGRQPLKKLKWYGLPRQTVTIKIFFKGCLSQILLVPFLNALSQINQVDFTYWMSF